MSFEILKDFRPSPANTADYSILSYRLGSPYNSNYFAETLRFFLSPNWFLFKAAESFSRFLATLLPSALFIGLQLLLLIPISQYLLSISSFRLATSIFLRTDHFIKNYTFLFNFKFFHLTCWHWLCILFVKCLWF